MTAVLDAAARRRSVLQSSSSVTVACDITGSGTDAASAVVDSLTALSSNPSAFLTALQAAGVPVTGLTVAAPGLSVAAPAVPALFNVSSAAQAQYFDVMLSTVATLAANVSQSQAVVLAATAADLLNAGSSLLSPAAATEVRTELMRVINATVAIATSSSEVEQIAVTVAKLVANATQVSAESAGMALFILDIISDNSARGSTLTNNTSQDVAKGLSSVVAVVLLQNNTLNVTALAQVSGIVNKLAASQLVGLAPGAAAVDTWSPAIQMRVQIDLPSNNSRLFTQGLTAPGSASAFAPLPLTMLANTGAGSNLSAGVATLFTSLRFDPHATEVDPSSTGITRLVLSSAATGEEISIAGLAEPVLFTLPPLPALGDGLKTQCQFWDVTAKAYSTVGCASLPDPSPPGHVVEWIAGFRAGSDADMARSWRVTGPLMDSSCAVQLLDCNAFNPGVAFENPAQPFSLPGISCDGESRSPKVVYVGSQCALIQANNTYGCRWNNTAQAFVGAGCVASGKPVSCSCRHVRRRMRCCLPCPA